MEHLFKIYAALLCLYQGLNIHTIDGLCDLVGSALALESPKEARNSVASMGCLRMLSPRGMVNTVSHV